MDVRLFQREKMEQRQHVDLIRHQREGFKHQTNMCFTSRQGGLLIKNHGVKQFDSLTTKNWRLNQQRESNSKSFESLDSILTILRIETTSKHGDLVIPPFLDYEIIPNILGSIISKLIINQPSSISYIH